MKKYHYLFLLLLGGCAGTSKSCASCNAESFGADWIVTQNNVLTGDAIKCWKLENVSVFNETDSDGIFWQDSHKNLIHISGNYNKVQVSNKNWKESADSLDIILEKCIGDKYKND